MFVANGRGWAEQTPGAPHNTRLIGLDTDPDEVLALIVLMYRALRFAREEVQ